MQNLTGVRTRLLVATACAVIAVARPSMQTSSLPSGWQQIDVGAPVVAGSASASGDTLTVVGAGTDVGGSGDEFRFVYQPSSGDVDIRVRVTSIQNVDPGVKAGLMIRESLDEGARNAFVFASPGQTVTFQQRTRANRNATQSAAVPQAAPQWLRLTRVGNAFKAYTSSSGTTWTLVGSGTVSMAANAYVGLAVTSHVASRTASASFDSLALGSATSGSLPAPWAASDVGGPSLAGSTGLSGGTFTVKGAGTDIWETSDQFQFVYQPVTGNTQVVAYIADLQAAVPYSKAGVMIRAALTGPAANAYMRLTEANGWRFNRRLVAGGTTIGTGLSSAPTAAPGWVRLVREGSLFSAYQSADGSAWTLIGSDTITMPATVYVGLAVTSNSPAALSTAAFSNVVVGAPSSSNTPPTVALSGPAGGSTYTAPASVALTATAGDVDGSITKVDFYAGTTLVGTDSSSPYSVTWSNAAAGSYSLTAVATDNAGATTTSQAVAITVNGAANKAPTVSLTGPAPGTTYTAPASVSLTASAADSDGTVAKVEFYAGTTLVGTDTSSPFGVTWSNAAAGSYSLTAVATDNGGAKTTSGAVGITVNAAANKPPTVSLSASGTLFTSPASLTLSASATDSDGTIAKVDFYAGTTLIGTDTSSPYSVAWGGVGVGLYSVTAVATDNAGAKSTSTAIAVTVQLPNLIPTTLTFAPGADYATNVTSYTVQLRRSTDAATATPIAPVGIGKPTIVAGAISADISSIVNPLAAGSYYAVVVTVGPGGSTPSAPSAAFTK